MAIKLNFENKRQIATILLAVGLGLMGVFLMSVHVEKSITSQTDRLSKQYKKDANTAQAAFVNELEVRDKKIRGLMKRMEDRQKAQIEKVAQQAAMAAARSAAANAGSGGNAPVQATEVDPLGAVRFSLLTPPGKRALTIVIDSLSAVGGLISAGDYVDILADVAAPDGREKTKDITTILFQRVQVLAVGSNFSPDANIETYQQQRMARSLNITLAVDPEEVGLVAFAQKFGKLRLALRSPTEKRVERLEVAAWESLSDYVLNKQGTELDVNVRRKSDSNSPIFDLEEIDEVEDFVEIYRGGQAL